MILTNYPGALLTATGTAWTNHNIRAVSGSITTIVVNRAEIFQMGQIKHAYLDFTITTNGTGATAILFTLREAPNALSKPVFAGREIGLTGNQLIGWPNGGTAGSSDVRITNHNNAYPGASGRRLVISGTYEA